MGLFDHYLESSIQSSDWSHFIKAKGTFGFFGLFDHYLESSIQSSDWSHFIKAKGTFGFFGGQSVYNMYFQEKV